MTVIYFSHHTKMYGDNTALLNLLKSFKQYEIKPIVVVPNSEGVFCSKLSELSIPFFVCKYKLSIYPSFYSLSDKLLFIFRLISDIATNVIALYRLYSYFTNKKIDIIHTNVGPNSLGFLLSKLLKVYHVWHIREYQDLDFGMKYFPSKSVFIKRLNSNNNFNITITESLSNYFNLKNNLTIIHDGIPHECNKVFVQSKEKFFLFVGRLEDGKGVMELIEAFAEINSKDYYLKIVGDGTITYINVLKKRINDLEINNKVFFEGFRNDVYMYMQKAKALIVPSRNEGFGLVTLEGILNGCLVIGRNSCGTKEILEKTNTGILYSNKIELIKHLNHLAECNINKYMHNIIIAQIFAENYYSSKKTEQEVIKLYRSIKTKR